MDVTGVFRPDERIVYREEDEGAFLFDPDTGDLRYMNLTGREAFAMLDGHRDLGEILAAMRNLYPEVEPAQLEDDVARFLGELLEGRFILPAQTR